MHSNVMPSPNSILPFLGSLLNLLTVIDSLLLFSASFIALAVGCDIAVVIGIFEVGEIPFCASRVS